MTSVHIFEKKGLVLSDWCKCLWANLLESHFGCQSLRPRLPESFLVKHGCFMILSDSRCIAPSVKHAEISFQMKHNSLLQSAVHNSTTLLSGGIDALRSVDQVDQVRQSSLYILLAMEGYAPQWKLAHACGPEWLSAEDMCISCLGSSWWRCHSGIAVWRIFGARDPFDTTEGDFWIGQARCAPGDRYRIAMGSTWNDCFQQEGAKLFRRDPCARECDFNSAWCILHPPVKPLPSFTAPNFNELVIYELHIGSFVSEADEKRAFAATTEKLEHISSLGFNCIQFMPTAEFGGIWGYNSRQLLASHGPWGSAAEMRVMVEKSHSLGMAVLFDVVLKHGLARALTFFQRHIFDIFIYSPPYN